MLVQPAEARREFVIVDGLVILAVVLERPHRLPQLGIVGGHHAALAACSNDLVLAERPGADIAERPNRLAPEPRTVCLGAVLDNRKTEIPCQGKHAVHLAGPAGEVHAENGTGARR
jgi:hypothetical protein